MADPFLTIKVPMAATEVARPFHRDGWVYEEKYDGWRMIAYKEGTAVRLVSRAGKDHSRASLNSRQPSGPCPWRL